MTTPWLDIIAESFWILLKILLIVIPLMISVAYLTFF